MKVPTMRLHQVMIADFVFYEKSQNVMVIWRSNKTDRQNKNGFEAKN